VFRSLLALGLISLLLSAASYAQSNFAALRLADGFDFPLGAPNADGYYKSRGFMVHGHLGEDWVSLDGPGKVFGAPVCAIGNGVVTLARDFRRAWGNVVVVRHVYLEDGQTKYIDSLYAHLDKILVAEGQPVSRGQQIGNVGNAHGLYAPHLHFEVHKNLSIGVVHNLFAGDFSNYYVPTTFIETHRTLKSGSQWLTVAIDTYVMPSFPGIPTYPPFRKNMAARLAVAAAAEARKNASIILPGYR
jgi:murein DD-endopeptidase MepM/ murein hydrolase activator NlpD